MTSQHTQSVMGGATPSQAMIINKGQFFTELERLKNMDHHRQKIDQIQQKDVRKSVKKQYDHYDPIKAEMKKKRNREFAEQRKLDVLTRENAKVLQKIVEARQINVKARNQLVQTIKKDEDRSRSVRDSVARKNVRKQSEIAMDNQRIAVKLFTQKPTYELLRFEKDFAVHRQNVVRTSKMAKLNIGSNASLMAIKERNIVSSSKSNLHPAEYGSNLEATRLPPIKSASRTANTIDGLQGEDDEESPSRNQRNIGSKKKSQLMTRDQMEAPFKTGNSGGVRKYETSLSAAKISPSTTMRGNNVRGSRFVQPQAVQLSPGLVMSSQVSQRQKKDLARYYTNLLGQKDQNSVNAYMAVGDNPMHHQSVGLADKKIKKKKNKKKMRAQSHASNTMIQPKGFSGATQSTKNMPTMENDLVKYQSVDNLTNEGSANYLAEVQSEMPNDGFDNQVPQEPQPEQEFEDIGQREIIVDNQSAL